jgi:hypothetical protein
VKSEKVKSGTKASTILRASSSANLILARFNIDPRGKFLLAVAWFSEPDRPCDRWGRRRAESLAMIRDMWRA